MLLLLASLLLATYIIRVRTQECPNEGLTPVRNSGTHNFVVDALDGNNFPFAIGQCTATSINPDTWYKYFCDKTTGVWVVAKREYTDDQCSGDGELSLNIDTQFEGIQQYYECDGNDDYLQIELGIGGCDSPVTIYAGLAACIHDTENESGDFEFYCNETTALVHYFGIMGNETLMSTTGVPMASTTALPLSSTNIMISSTQNEVNLSTTGFEFNETLPEFNMSTNLPEFNMTTNLPELNMTTNLPISSFLPSFLSTLVSLMPNSTFGTLLPTLSTLSTSISTSMCDDNEYCTVWVLNKDDCSLAQASSLRDFNVYVKMKLCSLSGQQTTSSGQQTTGSNIQTDKAGFIHSPLAITGILSLLFAVYWF